MKRISIALAFVAVLALAAASIATASTHRAKLKLHDTNVGKILVNGAGFTVYAFSKDGHNKDNCINISGCMSVWFPVRTTSKAKAGPGVKHSMIGTITLSNGIKQVTYNGHPLYTYSGDSGPGQTFYVGQFQSGGRWSAANAAGHKVN